MKFEIQTLPSDWTPSQFTTPTHFLNAWDPNYYYFTFFNPISVLSLLFIFLLFFP